MSTNLVWNSLAGSHLHLGFGNEFAKHYDPGVAPFGSFIDDSKRSRACLLSFLKLGDQICLVGQRFRPTEPVERISQSHAHQMYFRGPLTVAPVDAEGITQLSTADVPKMAALTDLVFPGFFRPGTIRMGDYFGIFHNGLLIAMAGERLAFGSHREISAVCTHPDHQRRGHALKLVKFLMERILRRGERPFLHVGVQNVRALPLYQNVGFVSENIAEINFYRRLDK